MQNVVSYMSTDMQIHEVKQDNQENYINTFDDIQVVFWNDCTELLVCWKQIFLKL